MSFYENTLIAKQDLPKSELNKIKDKYNDLINNNSGKVIKIEEWGLLNLANKIKNYKKGFFIHYKFEGDKETLNEISVNKPHLLLNYPHQGKRVPIFIRDTN